jgi:hypothetical protein
MLAIKSEVKTLIWKLKCLDDAEFKEALVAQQASKDR